MADNESTFYSYREFFPEYVAPRITNKFLVVSFIEETDDLQRKKKEFQPEKIYVYDDKLSMFFIESNQKRSETLSKIESNETHFPHMTPPYFSGDFSVYIRYLPVIRNISRCDRISPLNWPPNSIQIEYPRSANIRSDLNSHVVKSSSDRRRSRFKSVDERRRDSRRKKSSSASCPPYYKFSIGQLKPEQKQRKPSKQLSMLSEKKLRVQEMFIETVFGAPDISKDTEEDFELVTIDFPDLEQDVNTNFFVYFSLIKINKIPNPNIIDFPLVNIKPILKIYPFC